MNYDKLISILKNKNVDDKIKIKKAIKIIEKNVLKNKLKLYDKLNNSEYNYFLFLIKKNIKIYPMKVDSYLEALDKTVYIRNDESDNYFILTKEELINLINKIEEVL